MTDTTFIKLAEATHDLMDNFSQQTQTPETDIERYPFAEKPLFLFIYHPVQLKDIFRKQRCYYPMGHVASIYEGVCIDSTSDLFKSIARKGLVEGMKASANKWHNGRNTGPIGITLRRIAQVKQETKPFIFLLFPQRMGLDSVSLKQKMMSETMRINDYYILDNNCATHSLRPILGEEGIKKQFGSVLTPKEVLYWCDGLCSEEKAIRISHDGLTNYLSKLCSHESTNLFGENTNVILSHYLKARIRD